MNWETLGWKVHQGNVIGANPIILAIWILVLYFLIGLVLGGIAPQGGQITHG